MITRLDSCNDRLTCITQRVVQDVFHLSEHVDAIRSRSVECIFVRANTDYPQCLMKVMGFKGFKDFQLRPKDNARVHGLQERFLQEDQNRGFRMLAAGEIELREVANHQPQGAAKPMDLVRELLYEVVMWADAVCTTPHVAGEVTYLAYNKKIATATVLDEAGAMSGDERQLPPTVMTMGETREGKCANMFARYARVSILEHAKRSGWPCLPGTEHPGRAHFLRGNHTRL